MRKAISKHDERSMMNEAWLWQDKWAVLGRPQGSHVMGVLKGMEEHRM